MTRVETYRCDRCEGVEGGEAAFMNAAPMIAVEFSDHFPLDLKNEYTHICDACESDLGDLLLAAIEEWRANK